MGIDRIHTPVASATRSTSSNSGFVPIAQEVHTLTVGVDVTAITTTPTLDVTIEWTLDGGTTFLQGDPADAFTQLTAVGTAVKNFTVKGTGYRIAWVFGGAGDITFSVPVRERIA